MRTDWPSQLDSQTDNSALSELLKSSPEQTHVLTAGVGNIVNWLHFIDYEKFSKFLSYVLWVIKSYSLLN